MALVLNIPGLAPDRLALGLAVAQHVLDHAHLSVAEAAYGRWHCEQVVEGAAQPPGNEARWREAAQIFADAEREAIAAIYGRRKPPTGARLAVVEDLRWGGDAGQPWSGEMATAPR
jgi:hypothetical protein